MPEPVALSYTRGADVPLLEMTLSEALSRAAERFPDRDALVVCHQKARLSWRELDRQVTRVARGLAGLGLVPGDRAGIWASNCVEWILMQYATARAGVVLVNVNPAYRSHELRYVLQRSRIKALVLRARDSRADYRAILAESRNGEATAVEHEIWLGEESWDAMLAGGSTIPGTPPRPATSPTSSTRPARRARPRARCSHTATCSTTAWRSGWPSRRAPKTVSARRCRCTTASAR